MVASLAQNELAQLLALGPDDVTVVALAYVPPAVGITGARACSRRGSAAEERDDGGVEADRAVEACQLLVRAHLDRGFEEITEHRFESISGRHDLGLAQLFGQSVGDCLVDDAVLHFSPRGPSPK